MSSKRNRATRRAAMMRAAGAQKGGIPGADRPPTAGAPPAIPPIQTRRDQNAVAPAALIDRYPTIIGRSLTERYLSSVFRLALTGYRQQYVDLLDELLEHDPHLFSVVEKRILSTANGSIEITPTSLPADDPDIDLAKAASEMVQREVNQIRNLTQSVAALLWGVYYAVAAAEIMWTRDAKGWHVDRLDFVHSRRLSYPDAQSWDLHIWDQGQVLGWGSGWGDSATNGDYFGTRIADWPGKFIVFAPQIRGDYPTREGVGRQVASWSLFKRIGARGAMDYLERFAKGFMDGTYTTQDSGEPREATPEDKAILADALNDIGPGGTSYAMHPDSTTIKPMGYEGTGTAKITYQEWIDICDGQNSKATLGGTLGTDHKGSGGLGGSGTAEVQERSEVDIEQFDATCFAEAFRSSVVYWLVRMNMPEALHVLPLVAVNVEREPDAKTIVANATTLADRGAPVDVDDIGVKTGIKMTPNETGKPRQLFKSDFIDPSTVDPNLMSEEAKQEKQDAADAAQKLAEAKAAQPVVVPGGGSAAPANGKPASGIRPKPGQAAGKTKPNAGKPAKMVHLPYDEDAIEAGHRVLLSDVNFHLVGRAIAQEVYDLLLEDYPPSSLGWILSAQWRGPVEVPIDAIDFSHADLWRASHEPIDAYVERIKNGKRKPTVMVVTPSSTLCKIVDGHHRTLAQKSLGMPVLTYVANVQVDEGPWETLHNLQKKGSSRVASYTEPASYRESNEIDANA